MRLSKSKYCNSVQCNKMLWLNVNKPELKDDVVKQSILDNGTEVGLVAKDLFGEHIDIPFNENLIIMLSQTKEVLKKSNVVVTEASFLYENNFCSVDILKKDNDFIEIYEVKSSTQIENIYYDDIAFQTYILLMLGYKVSKTCIVYLNNQYERKGELELDKLFNIEDVTEIVMEKQEEVSNKITEINNYLKQNDEPIQDIGIHCMQPYDCPFFNHCTRHLPENNVFNIRKMTSNKKFELYGKGIYRYDDLLNENINWKYRQQIEYEMYDKEPTINIENIREFLNTLSYPLYFLDFESYQQPIPKYDGVKPYMQIPFQYSLHYIEMENSQLEHKEFLAEANVDPRRKLAEQLVRDIPMGVCILAYNMSFEKTVIKNLANLYSDLREHLMNIHDNMKDLMIPFINRDYYTKDMYGSYSIKYVLPALFPNEPSLDYHSLDLIHNGSEAMSSYANLGNLSEEEQDKVRNSLLKYCELDTYAMVKIWERLVEVCK